MNIPYMQSVSCTNATWKMGRCGNYTVSEVVPVFVMLLEKQMTMTLKLQLGIYRHLFHL